MEKTLLERFLKGDLGSGMLGILSRGTQFLMRKEASEKAREEGKTFARLKDIPRKERHKHRFRWGGRIDGAFPQYFVIRKGKIPSTYRCECGESAYSCNNCEYVPGIPDKKKYIEGSAQFADAGYRYLCRICGEKLGEKVTTRKTVLL